MERAGRRVDGEGEVVDVVKAVVARLAGGKDIAESDVVTRACVGGEVDGAVYIVGAGVVDGVTGVKDEALERLVMTPTCSWYLVWGCLR